MSSRTKPRRNVKQTDQRLRRRGRGGRSARGGGITYPNIARKIWRDVQMLKAMINVEDKYIDTNVAFTAFASTAPVYTLLNGMQLGTGPSARIGQSIRAASIQMNIGLTQNTSAVNTFVRIMLVVDSQPNSAAPGANDILTTGADPFALRYVPFLPRFNVLYDELIVLTSSNEHGQVLSCTLPLGFHVQYNTSNAGTIADINKNSLYLVLQSQETVNFASYAFDTRFSFVDN